MEGKARIHYQCSFTASANLNVLEFFFSLSYKCNIYVPYATLPTYTENTSKDFLLLLEEIQTEQHHFLITHLLKTKYTVYSTHEGALQFLRQRLDSDVERQSTTNQLLTS